MARKDAAREDGDNRPRVVNGRSSNLDWWSIARNDEIAATILSVRFGREMDLMYDSDLNDSVPIDSEQWKSRSIFERIDEAFARILEPML